MTKKILNDIQFQLDVLEVIKQYGEYNDQYGSVQIFGGREDLMIMTYPVGKEDGYVNTIEKYSPVPFLLLLEEYGFNVELLVAFNITVNAYELPQIILEYTITPKLTKRMKNAE